MSQTERTIRIDSELLEQFIQICNEEEDTFDERLGWVVAEYVREYKLYDTREDVEKAMDKIETKDKPEEPEKEPEE